MTDSFDQHPPRLSEDEKQQLYRDGMVIVRHAIPPSMTQAALEVINANPENKGFTNNSHTSTIGLYTESILPELIDEVMGPHTRPITGFVALTPPAVSYTHLTLPTKA